MSDAPTIDSVRRELRKHVANAKAMGASVEPGAVGVFSDGSLVPRIPQPCCCLLGVSIIGLQRDDDVETYYETAARVLGINSEQMRAVERGFEDRSSPPRLADWYALGAEFRKEGP